MYNFLIYLIVLALTIWAMDGVNINNIFKKNSIYQARVFYIIVVLSLAYLASSFIISFLTSLK